MSDLGTVPRRPRPEGLPEFPQDPDRTWISYVGKGAYSEELFIKEASALGFSRNVSPWHFVQIHYNDLVFFARWKESEMAKLSKLETGKQNVQSDGVATIFGVGVVRYWEVRVDWQMVEMFKNRLNEILEDPQADDVAKENARKALTLIYQFENSIERLDKAIPITRGCGSYAITGVSNMPFEDFRKLVKAALIYGFTSAFKLAIAGPFWPFSIRLSFRAPFSRSITHLTEEMRRAMETCVNTGACFRPDASTANLPKEVALLVENYHLMKRSDSKWKAKVEEEVKNASELVDRLTSEVEEARARWRASAWLRAEEELRKAKAEEKKLEEKKATRLANVVKTQRAEEKEEEEEEEFWFEPLPGEEEEEGGREE